jgi:thymidine kinase
MFAGKTRELIRRVRFLQQREASVCVLKPVIDDRYSTDEVVSHDGARLRAQAISLDCDDLPTDCSVVALDEVQFFTAKAVDRLMGFLGQGRHIIAAGLDLTWRGEPFGQMARLLCLADDVTKLKAKCACCGLEASRSFRVVQGGDDVLVGGAEKYEPRCVTCFGRAHG